MIFFEVRRMPGGKHILGRPKGRHVFGTARVGERGQIVIPKEVRAMFGLEPGDTLVLLADKKRGIALQTTEKLSPLLRSVFDGMESEEEDEA
mgnify:CR=1 FL=1